MANAYAPWLTNPNQALAPVMSVGVGKFLIASKNFLLGLMFVGVIVSPAKIDCVLGKLKLFGIKGDPIPST